MNKQQKILIVDDIKLNLKAMQAILRKVDAEIILAESGNEALALVLQHQFALILLDVQMPEMDGFEVAKILHHDEKTAHTPIIFVTAVSREVKYIHKGYHIGAVDYLLKPVDTDALLSKANVFLRLAKITDELNEHKNNLEQKITERTRELSESLEREMLANNTKSEFISNMSHEFRTPMHGILGFSYMGIKRQESAPREKLGNYFKNINESGNRLLDLLNNLLDLSKLEAAEMDFIFTQANLKIITEKCKNRKQISLKYPSISIRIKEESRCNPSCDEIKISQVITNLLANAIKFSNEQGRIEINIIPAPLALGNGQIVDGIQFSMTDNGVGIPEQELELIFDKFTQSTKTKTNAGGIGLGLSISQEIIKGHQGKIWAEQNEGGGAIFKFIIPLTNL